MTKFVPYLRDDVIERDAAALLAEYEGTRGRALALPIPIEDIVEKHLKLGVEFDDAHRRFGVPRSGPDPDIIGAMFFDEARIMIDESLDPDEHPEKEGRYRFTLAHESGHWRLHRRLFANDPTQALLFGESAPVPSFVCRSSKAKERVEWQADFYASCLLMPRELVFAAWDERFPGQHYHVMDRRRRDEIARMPDVTTRGDELDYEEWQTDLSMEAFARPLAEAFLVSPHAMRIRLEKLGLLFRDTPKQPLLVVGA